MMTETANAFAPNINLDPNDQTPVIDTIDSAGQRVIRPLFEVAEISGKIHRRSFEVRLPSALANVPVQDALAILAKNPWYGVEQTAEYFDRNRHFMDGLNNPTFQKKTMAVNPVSLERLRGLVGQIEDMPVANFFPELAQWEDFCKEVAQDLTKVKEALSKNDGKFNNAELKAAHRFMQTYLEYGPIKKPNLS